MQFITINEYFYKLYSVVMVIILPPIVAFIVLYLQPVQAETEIAQSPGTYIVFSSVVAVLWTIMFILFNKKIKSLRNHQGLRQKLEKYFRLTIVRYTLLSISGLILAGGFLVLHHDFFTAFFLVQLMLAVILWPRSAKVSRDLKLRGDEREMVYFKKDVL